MASRIAIIAHGRFRGHKTLESLAERIGHSPFYTDRPLHAEELASHLPTDVTKIVVAGGDGIVHEVVNGVMRLSEERRPALAVLPLGSGNDTARGLGISSRLKPLYDRLADHTIEVWDVIRLSYTNVDGQPAERYCINVADVGLGGRVTQMYSEDLRRFPGGLGYLVASFKGFRSSDPTVITVDTGIQERKNLMLMVAICNSPWFGSGIGIAPHADTADGLMDLTLVGNVTAGAYVRHLPRLWRGKAVNDDRMEYLRTRTVTVTAEVPQPLEIDGEFSGFTPVHAEVVPRAIRFLV